eukprot:TRINITY_DN34048_c0_g1_i1.p1 TRINITY_DN34048_c0_g1~~TRINITY_DN34048_c0_g1_i1.p1  ORF type:complete len:339 (+),score=19.41 TRINITY_DN34048_c0_g1_i1:69-1085(+)
MSVGLQRASSLHRRRQIRRLRLEWWLFVIMLTSFGPAGFSCNLRGITERLCSKAGQIRALQTQGLLPCPVLVGWADHASPAEAAAQRGAVASATAAASFCLAPRSSSAGSCLAGQSLSASLLPACSRGRFPSVSGNAEGEGDRAALFVFGGVVGAFSLFLAQEIKKETTSEKKTRVCKKGVTDFKIKLEPLLSFEGGSHGSVKKRIKITRVKRLSSKVTFDGKFLGQIQGDLEAALKVGTKLGPKFLNLRIDPALAMMAMALLDTALKLFRSSSDGEGLEVVEEVEIHVDMSQPCYLYKVVAHIGLDDGRKVRLESEEIVQRTQQANASQGWIYSRSF